MLAGLTWRHNEELWQVRHRITILDWEQSKKQRLVSELKELFGRQKNIQRKSPEKDELLPEHWSCRAPDCDWLTDSEPKMAMWSLRHAKPTGSLKQGLFFWTHGDQMRNSLPSPYLNSTWGLWEKKIKKEFSFLWAVFHQVCQKGAFPQKLLQIASSVTLPRQSGPCGWGRSTWQLLSTCRLSEIVQRELEGGRKSTDISKERSGIHKLAGTESTWWNKWLNDGSNGS